MSRLVGWIQRRHAAVVRAADRLFLRGGAGSRSPRVWLSTPLPADPGGLDRLAAALEANREPVPPGAHGPADGVFLYSIASALDIFMIWTLVLTAIGFTRVSKVKSGTAYAIVFGWWVFFTLVGASIGAAFS